MLILITLLGTNSYEWSRGIELDESLKNGRVQCRERWVGGDGVTSVPPFY